MAVANVDGRLDCQIRPPIRLGQILEPYERRQIAENRDLGNRVTPDARLGIGQQPRVEVVRHG